MTTVAVKNGEMAADTQLTGCYSYRVQKIFRLQDGGLVGGAGTWNRAYAAIQWLIEGQGDPPKFEDASLLILRPDGSLWMADDEFPAYPLLDKFAAIGVGALAAVTAMRAGLSAGDAVKAACDIEPNTSGPVQMLSLEKKTPRKRGK